MSVEGKPSKFPGLEKDPKVSGLIKTIDVYKGAIERSLRTICLTLKFMDDNEVSAIIVWELIETGKQLSNLIPDSKWSEEFKKRTHEG